MKAPNPFLILSVIIFLFTLAILWVLYYDSVNDAVEKVIVRVLGVVGTASINETVIESKPYYTLYDDQWISGIESLGDVVQKTENIASPIVCSNLLHGADRSLKAVAANYYPDTRICNLVDSVTPINVNPQSQLIMQSSDLANNSVSAWSGDDTTTTGGNIFCSTSLSYLPYLKALCSAIGECSAFTLELDPTTGVPSGCLKYSNKKTPALNTTSYTGFRPDAKPLAQNFSYTYDSTFVNGTQIGPTLNNVDINTCQAQLVQESTSADGTIVNTNISGVWDYSNGGTCTIFDASATAQTTSKTSTIFNILVA